MRAAEVRSIRARLTLTLAVVMVAVVLGGAVVASLAIFPLLSQRDLAQLENTAQRMAAGLTATGGAVISEDTVQQIAADSLGIILLADQAVLAAAGIPEEDVATVVTRADDEPTDIDGRYLAETIDTTGLSVSFREEGTEVPVTSAVLVVRTADREANGVLLITALSVTSLATTIILIVAAAIVVGRGLRPLTAMAEHAERIAEGDRTLRLPVEAGEDPAIARMASTVNLAFDVQEDAENRMRSFVADASHELRTPLTTASGWVELYLRGGLNDPDALAEAMSRVERQLGRMRLLADELSLLARTDTGRPLENTPVDLADVVAEVVADARVLHPERRITVLGTGPAPVLGDEPRLTQVVRNLVGNALQHTPPDAEVTVSAAVVADRVVLTVHDTGPGIPSDQLPHVFERFWRGQNSRHAAGSGLGLAIAHALVSAHGGILRVTSAPGEGTTFEANLPALDAQLP
jgi:two-component system OmpR family sensor kinase